MDALNIAIAGLGTVGAEVARQLLHRKTALGKAAGRPLILSAVSARNATKDRGFSMAGIAFEAEDGGFVAMNDNAANDNSMPTEGGEQSYNF